MVRYIKKRLLGRTVCGLLMVMGSVGHTTYGSGQTHFPSALPDLNDRYLGAVRVGDVETVRLLSKNRALNVNAVDGDGNTDLMLAIRGGGRDDFDPRYQQIFDFIIHVQEGNRNLNLQNNRGQTALLLAVGWGRLGCLEVLLGRPEVDPNIPNADGATPLIAAIGNTFISNDLRVSIASRLIDSQRVNVNQRGTDNKLPLQIAFDAGLLRQLANPICRRSLADYYRDVKKITLEMIESLVSSLPARNGERLSSEQAEAVADELLSPLNVGNAAQVAANPVSFNETIKGHIDVVLNRQREIDKGQAIAQNTVGVLSFLVTLWHDPRVNVNDYKTCQPKQIVDVILRSIHFTRTHFIPKTASDNLYLERFKWIEANTRLYDNFLMWQDFQSLTELFTRLQ